MKFVCIRMPPRMETLSSVLSFKHLKIYVNSNFTYVGMSFAQTTFAIRMNPQKSRK